MQYPTIDLSDANPTLATGSEVAAIAKPLAALGISHLTFTRIDKAGGRTYLSNLPDIMRFYFQKKYYLVGNTEGHPSKYQSQVVMWDTLPNQSIYDDCVRARNIDHGMYIIEPHDDYCDFFGLATVKGNSSIINTYLTKLDYLKNFTSYFKQEAKQIIKQVSNKKIILPFNDKITDLTYCAQLEKDNIVIKNNDGVKVKMTQRQLEIAEKFLQGKSFKEIAKELKLSPRTIETHINHLKEKLECENRTMLILELVKIIHPNR